MVILSVSPAASVPGAAHVAVEPVMTPATGSPAAPTVHDARVIVAAAPPEATLTLAVTAPQPAAASHTKVAVCVVLSVLKTMGSASTRITPVASVPTKAPPAATANVVALHTVATVTVAGVGAVAGG